MSFWDDAIAYSLTLRHIRNPYRRLLKQNYEELRIFLRRGGDYNRAVKIKRLVRPISLLETLLLPYIWLLNIMIYYLRRKARRKAYREGA